MYKSKCHKTWELLFCCYLWLPMPSSALYQLCWFRKKQTYFMSVFAQMLVSERLLVLLKITAVFKVELWQGDNCTPCWMWTPKCYVLICAGRPEDSADCHRLQQLSPCRSCVVGWDLEMRNLGRFFMGIYIHCFQNSF